MLCYGVQGPERLVRMPAGGPRANSRLPFFDSETMLRREGTSYESESAAESSALSADIE